MDCFFFSSMQRIIIFHCRDKLNFQFDTRMDWRRTKNVTAVFQWVETIDRLASDQLLLGRDEKHALAYNILINIIEF
jgi:hypothetical protein